MSFLHAYDTTNKSQHRLANTHDPFQAFSPTTSGFSPAVGRFKVMSGISGAVFEVLSLAARDGVEVYRYICLYFPHFDHEDHVYRKYVFFCVKILDVFNINFLRLTESNILKFKGKGPATGYSLFPYGHQ